MTSCLGPSFCPISPHVLAIGPKWQNQVRRSAETAIYMKPPLPSARTPKNFNLVTSSTVATIQTLDSRSLNNSLRGHDVAWRGVIAARKRTVTTICTGENSNLHYLLGSRHVTWNGRIAAKDLHCAAQGLKGDVMMANGAKIKLVGIGGSLRKASCNSGLLRAGI
jgi:hypothetical protein